MPLAPLVITGAALELTRTLTFRVLGPLALLAPKVTAKSPETLGVPLICPVLTLTLKPAGKPVAV